MHAWCEDKAIMHSVVVTRRRALGNGHVERYTPSYLSRGASIIGSAQWINKSTSTAAFGNPCLHVEEYVVQSFAACMP